MAIVCQYGRPSLFITFTANPEWDEITRELLLGQQPTDRPDPVARVFHMKLKHLLHDLKKRISLATTPAPSGPSNIRSAAYRTCTCCSSSTRTTVTGC